MNSINLVGRITAEPELKKSNTGNDFCKFSLAVQRPFNTKITDFFSCIAFGKTAETIAKYVKKGNRLGITGILETSKVEKTTYYTVNVNSISLLENSNGSSGNSSARRAEVEDDFDIEEETPKTRTKKSTTIEDDDEYPF